MASSEYFAIQEQLERLRGRYDRLIRAVEQTADTVIITNRQGVIEYVNPAFGGTTGYSESEAHYKPANWSGSFQHNLWEIGSESGIIGSGQCPPHDLSCQQSARSGRQRYPSRPVR